jgi:putative Ca2+/H+ antiporter (TMEM165/GDT1 family)
VVLAGFTTAFATVAVAGIGDKSFLTTFLLAARHKARWVFTGSVLALTIGAGLWICIGVWMRSTVSIDLIKTVSGITFLLFGIKSLADGFGITTVKPAKTTIEEQRTFDSSLHLPANAVIRNSFTTTFLAEFGDKTQLALLALAAGPDISAESVFTGAVAANIFLAIAAVTSGKLLKSKICQKKIAIISGVLFVILGIKILLP